MGEILEERFEYTSRADMIASTASSEQTSLMLCPVDEAISRQIIPHFHATQTNVKTFNLVVGRYRVADHLSLKA